MCFGGSININIVLRSDGTDRRFCETALLLFFPFGNGYAKLAKLSIVNRCRALGHKFTGVLHLGEGGYIAQCLAAQHLHAKAVEAYADSAVGRCAVFESAC